MNTSTPRTDADAGGHSEGAPATLDPPDGLRGFRRYTYWSMVVAAFVLLLLPMLAGPVPLPPDALGTVELAGVLVVVAAVMRLTERHIPRTPEALEMSARQRRVWATVGGVASLAVATTSALGGDEILWAFAPAMIASLLLAELTRRRRMVGVGAAMVLAAAAGVGIRACQVFCVRTSV